MGLMALMVDKVLNPKKQKNGKQKGDPQPQKTMPKSQPTPKAAPKANVPVVKKNMSQRGQYDKYK